MDESVEWKTLSSGSFHFTEGVINWSRVRDRGKTTKSRSSRNSRMLLDGWGGLGKGGTLYNYIADPYRSDRSHPSAETIRINGNDATYMFAAGKIIA